MKKRLLCILLAAIMIIGVIPMNAFAEEADPSVEPAAVETVVDETAADETEETESLEDDATDPALLTAVPYAEGEEGEEDGSSEGIVTHTGEVIGRVRVTVENTTFPVNDGAPWDGVLVDEWVDLYNDSSAMSVVADSLAAHGYEQTGAENNYISEINGLGEFDGGGMSGWMGTLNEWFTNEGFGAFNVANGKFVNGDWIHVMYTCDYGSDIGGSWSNNDKTIAAIAFGAGTLSEDFSSDVHEYTLTVPEDCTGVSVLATAANKNFQVRTFSSAASNDAQRCDEERYLYGTDSSLGVMNSGFKPGATVPVAAEGSTIIKVVCGDPEWPSMNSSTDPAEVYTITVVHETPAVELPAFAGMSFTIGTSTSTSQLVSMSPEFDPDVREYTVVVPDTAYSNSTKAVYTHFDLGEAADAEPTLVYTNTSNAEIRVAAKNDTNGRGTAIANLLTKNTLGSNTVTIEDSEGNTLYTVHFVRQATPKSFSVEGYTITPGFAYYKNEYAITVPSGTRSVTVNATAAASDAVITYNGSESNVVPLTFDENREATVEVVVAPPEGSESLAFNITLTVYQAPDPDPIELTASSTTAMFKAVSGSIEVVDGQTYLRFALSSTGYQDLFVGTYEEANATTSGETIDSSNWVHYTTNAAGKYEFVIPIEEGQTYIPVAALSASKAAAGDYKWYPRQLVIDYEARTLVSGDYDNTVAIAVQDDAEAISAASAAIRTIGGPNSNNYAENLILTMGEGNAFTQAYVGTAAEAAEATATIAITDGAFVIPMYANQMGGAVDFDRLDQDITVSFSDGEAWTEVVINCSKAEAKVVISDVEVLQGQGTEADPYLITQLSDLQYISDMVAGGESYSGKYFKMTADIELPADWTPIGTSAKPFSGHIDCDNHLLTVAEGGKSLIGFPVAASISNLNIYGTQIAGYGLVESYVVGATIDLTNITLKSGTQTLMSGLIGGYASGSNALHLTNCTAEEGVVVGYDRQQSNIGGLAGEFNGFMDNCSFAGTVYGVNFVGGLVGNKGQTMGSCDITNSTFTGTVVATGNYVGGIAGAGYGGTNWGLASAPNTPGIVIKNCESNGTIAGANYVGGILGAEPGMAQAWNNGIGYIQNNTFTGTVSATAENPYIGAVIGYMHSLNVYTVISGNTYAPNCGAQKGIGGATYVDTNCMTHETASGATYFNTESGDNYIAPPEVGTGWNKVNWRANHNRTDDPLGADAEALCAVIAPVLPAFDNMYIADTTHGTLTMIPEFSADVRDYTVIVTDDASSASANRPWLYYVSGEEMTAAAPSIVYVRPSNGADTTTSLPASGSLTLRYVVLSNSFEGNTLDIKDAAGNTLYTLNFVRQATLSNISVDGSSVDVSGFTSATTECTATVYEGTESITVNATATVEGAAITYNGETSNVVPLTFNEEGIATVEVTVGSAEENSTVVPTTYTITINTEPAVLQGHGTEEDPFLITQLSDLQYIADKVAAGTFFKDKFFRMTADIELPADWTPIGDFSHVFSGSIDCDNHTLTVAEGGLPLFGNVQYATVKNLNIYGTRIAGYGLVNNLSGLGKNTPAITIENCTIKSGTQTLESGFIGMHTTGYAGSSAGFLVTIKDCTVEEGVVIGYSGEVSEIGSFAGRVNAEITNCVSYATVKGANIVGGIVSNIDNAMGTLNVTNCEFHGTVIASGEFAGGIVGSGYDDGPLSGRATGGSAPNGVRPTIVNCSSDGSITGGNCVGGIIGGDLYIAQTWNNKTESITGNTFTGTVAATAENAYVGGIIGYYNSLNRYNTISGNSYSAGCGATAGIGFVKYLDTNAADATVPEGTINVNTEGTKDNCPTVKWCSWMIDHFRTDDPLGADAEALCAVIKEPVDIEGIYRATENLLVGQLEEFTPTVGSIGGEWWVLGLARSGDEIPAGYYDNVVASVTSTINASEQLHKNKSTENSRVILALTSIGIDPRNIAGGHDLIAGFTNLTYLNRQGINGPIWALIALDSHNYEIAEGSTLTREEIINAILAKEIEGGGWALSGSNPDPDMTGMALQALAPYYNTNDDVHAAVDRALTVLSNMQQDNGGYASWGSVNSESCAQVIVALTALGIDPQTDARFIKNGTSVVEAMCEFAVEGGGFRHVMSGELNGMATEQAFYALTAYYRFVNGQNRLYDMTDVELTRFTDDTVAVTTTTVNAAGDVSGMYTMENAVATKQADGTYLVRMHQVSVNRNVLAIVDGFDADLADITAHHVDWHVGTGDGYTFTVPVASLEDTLYVAFSSTSRIAQGKAFGNVMAITFSDAKDTTEAQAVAEDINIDPAVAPHVHAFTGQVVIDGQVYDKCECGETQINTEINGLKKVGGTWVYTEDGVVTGLNALAKNEWGWWYIGEDGKIDFNYTGVAQNQWGSWYVVNGKLDQTVNGLIKVNGTWTYFVNGKVTALRGLAKNDYGWWYIGANGTIDFTYTGIARNDWGTWHVVNGKLDQTINGLQKVNGSWIYFVNGKVTGLKGLAKNDYGWWYIGEDGRIDFNFTGIASNAYGQWYVKNGKLDQSYSGTVNFGGRTYTVVSGKVR